MKIEGYDGQAAYYCTECGALIAVGAVELHETWHARLDELFTDLYAREQEWHEMNPEPEARPSLVLFTDGRPTSGRTSDGRTFTVKANE